LTPLKTLGLREQWRSGISKAKRFFTFKDVSEQEFEILISSVMILVGVSIKYLNI